MRRGVLWKRPFIGHDWGMADVHRQVGWSELFADLVVVATAVQISDALKKDLSWSTVISTGVQFALFWSSWMNFTAYVNRFPVEDLVHRLYLLSFIASQFFCGVFIEDFDHLNDTKKGFAVAYLAANVTVRSRVFLRLVLWWGVPWAVSREP